MKFLAAFKLILHRMYEILTAKVSLITAAVCRDSLDSLDYHLKKVVDDSEGVSLDVLNIWTEDEDVCGDHCYHTVKSSSEHLRNVKKGMIHKDYICCKCTHGLCSSFKEGIPVNVRVPS